MANEGQPIQWLIKRTANTMANEEGQPIQWLMKKDSQYNG